VYVRRLSVSIPLGSGRYTRFQRYEKNQCALCKELEHWKVDCPKAKGRKKKSKTEANLAQVVSTHASTSQADGSNSDSSVFSFSITTPIIG